MTDDAVLDEIEELLSAPAAGEGAPTLARMEDALTGGYAHALALEAERRRLERRLGEVVRLVSREDPSGSTNELAELATRMHSADGELTHLRRLLVTLRDRARAVRGGAVGPRRS